MQKTLVAKATIAVILAIPSKSMKLKKLDFQLKIKSSKNHKKKFCEKEDNAKNNQRRDQKKLKQNLGLKIIC